MRKSFFTLVLAIAAGVCMTSEATCLTQAPDELYWSFITVSGTIQWLDSPCEEGEECPPCVTPAIVTSDKTYYLSSSNQEVRDFLDRIEWAPLPAIYLLPLQARASGTPYTQGSFDFLVVNNIVDLYVEYFSDQQENKLPSLCDEWNIAKISNVTGPIETIHTVKAVLGSDTVIESQNYVKLIEDGAYKGALREGESGVIYYIPSGSAHEYLLYNFNAQVGDRLTNLWYGGRVEWCPNGYNATVLSISEGMPRVFTVEVQYIFSLSDGDHIDPWLVYWTEGVGLSDGPVGQPCPGPLCACSCGQVVLCAYKNGEHIYTSALGEQYGCVYNYDPYSTPVDTIPLYAGDNPGSSTVDPVDPNQVVVTLKGDELTIRESSGEEIMMALSLNQGDASVPAFNRVQRTQSFQNELTVTLTEEGLYRLELSNPSWEYNIFGTFNYPQRKDAIDQNVVPTPAAQKIIRNGQLLIRKGEKIYTVQGAEVNE